MSLAGQTINDRLLAARHSLAGQGLAKSVCKATTEECIGPKKKHLDYLVHCTNEPNVSIPHLANLLIERSQNANWVVVYKALITTHHLMAYGNERFMQYLASSISTFNLSSFLDKGGVQGGMSVPGGRMGYEMSPFIRRYAKYLNEKSLSYRAMAFDFCKVKRGKEEGSLRVMNTDKLLKTLPVLQAQLDGLLEFDCQANDLTNGVINMSFMLLFRDLIRLFACYNDGIINLLEKYFDMNKKQAREALDLYKRFLVRMDRVGEFLKVAENVGIDKGDIPDLTKAPSSLLDALEQHLASLEGRKLSAANTPTQSASSAFGTAAASSKFDATNGIDEQLKAQALADEEAAMNQYKSKLSSPTSGGDGANAALTNPFLSSPTAAPAAGAPIVDLFGAASVPSTGNGTINSSGTSALVGATKASDDLLQLGNPFADMFDAPSSAMPAASGFNGSTVPSAGNAFVSDSNFSSVFGNTEPTEQRCWPTSDPNPFLNPFMLESSPTSISPSNSFTAPAISTASAANNFSGKAAFQRAPNNFFENSTSPAFLFNSEDQMWSTNGGGTYTASVAGNANSTFGSMNSMFVPKLPLVPMPPCSSTFTTYSTNQSNVKAGAQISSGFDALGDVLKPGITSATTGGSSKSSLNQSNVVTAGGMARFEQQQNQQQQQQMAVNNTSNNTGKLLTGDLDSSLMSLVENLNINKSSTSTKPVQWNSPKNAAKPGSNWTPQPMAATTGAGYRPMAYGLTVCPAPITTTNLSSHPYIHATTYPVFSNFIQGMPVMAANSQPMMAPVPLTGAVPTPMMMTGSNVSTGVGVMPTTNGANKAMMASSTTKSAATVPLDPFGAL